MKILVTGATGYIGGRLIPKLLEAGHEVRAFVRDRERLKGKKWFSRIQIAEGDLEKAETLTAAFESIDAAYFLVHAMFEGDDFAEREKRDAENFVAAAGAAKGTKIIYLGGLLPANSSSEHLKSRAAG